MFDLAYLLHSENIRAYHSYCRVIYLQVLWRHLGKISTQSSIKPFTQAFNAVIFILWHNVVVATAPLHISTALIFRYLKTEYRSQQSVSGDLSNGRGTTWVQFVNTGINILRGTHVCSVPYQFSWRQRQYHTDSCTALNVSIIYNEYLKITHNTVCNHWPRYYYLQR